MGVQHVDLITSAVAPIVIVSAAGLLFMGVQTKNLHLSDRIRTLMAEYRALTPKPADEARRQQILQQVVLFNRRIRLSQRSLELLYIAIVCFVLTSLFLAAAPWVGRFFMPVGTAGVFVAGVVFLLLALLMEYREMHVGLKTIATELEPALKDSRKG